MIVYSTCFGGQPGPLQRGSDRGRAELDRAHDPASPPWNRPIGVRTPATR